MKRTGLFVLLGVTLAATGCTSTSKGRGVAETGFLGADYALLGAGGPGQAARVYMRPGTEWSTYGNVLLDPVTVWRSTDAPNRGVSAQDAQILTDYFYGVIRGALEKDGFQLVSSPGAHTLRVKVAITEAHAQYVALDIVSTVVPSAHAASALDHLITGKPAFVGEAQIEVKATDALTGQLLAAAIDHRVGGKTISASQFNSWGDVETMMRLWAGHGAYRLCELAGRAGCVPPTKS